MTEFLLDNLLLLPFLFVTYLVLELMEARANGALERSLGRTRRMGPLIGTLAGIFPQCGVSAAAASLYAGGAITVGTLIAVFLSTSDELIPVLISEKVPVTLILKIVAAKVVAGVAVGFAVNAVMTVFGRGGTSLHVDELCAHSKCSCHERKGVLVPALIHTAEIFLFILVVSAVFEIALHYLGEDSLRSLVLNDPWIGESIAGLVGFIPNCAVSVSCAQLYLKGGMSSGALMAMSMTGSGVGLLVLFRTNRHWVANVSIMAVLYVTGVVLGHFAGFFI